MPEGHTIHRMARDHTRWLGGQVVQATSPQGRFAEEAHALDGAAFDRAEAKGKHLFWRFRGLDKPRVVHIHLGLFGRFRRYVRKVPAPRDTVRIRLRSEACTLDLTGPNTCELLTLPARRAVLDRLGDDPLRDDADPERVLHTLSRTRRALGAVLLDQSVIAGIGNVYRAELLFRQRLPPSLPARELSRERFEALWQDTVHLLELGVALNRIVTRADTVEAAKALPRYERLWVYKRRRCAVCDSEIAKTTSAGRTLYSCPVCQG